MSSARRLLPAGLSVSDAQLDLLDAYGRELRRMNQRINLVSSETESEFWKRHTAHCLALATRSFPAGARIVDWGTGGGLPAIPLAVMFPTCEVIGVDAVRKKVQSCTAIARRLALDNCTFVHGRAEQVSLSTDYSVSRATAPLATLWAWHTRVAGDAQDADAEAEPAAKAGADAKAESAAKSDTDADARPASPELHASGPAAGAEESGPSLQWPRGLICLKGGELSAEFTEMKKAAADRGRHVAVQTFPLSDLFDDPWFEEKVIISVA